jgi:hypothetical protein
MKYLDFISPILFERVTTGRVCNCLRWKQVVHILSFYQGVFEEQETTLFSNVQHNSCSMHCRSVRYHCNCDIAQKSTPNANTQQKIKCHILCDTHKRKEMNREGLITIY